MSSVNVLNVMNHTCMHTHMYAHTHLTEVLIYIVVEGHQYGHNKEILH